MKKLFLLLLLVAPAFAATIPPPKEATAADVTAGTRADVFISPRRAVALTSAGAALGTSSQTNDYTLVAGDAGKIIALNNAAAKTITVPANATVAFPVGTRMYPRQDGAGAVSIAAAGGVTLTQRSGTVVIGAAGHYATLLKTGTNTWELTVDMLDKSAASDPTTGDDAADGYQVGSIWQNTSTGVRWQCFDNTTSSSVWRKIVQPLELIVALSDETTAITTGTAKVTIRAPRAMTITGVRASVNTVSSSGIPTVDINEAGATILSTKLTIDASELTSYTAAAAAVISDASIADDAELTFDIDVAGTGAKGLKVCIYYN